MAETWEELSSSEDECTSIASSELVEAPAKPRTAAEVDYETIHNWFIAKFGSGLARTVRVPPRHIVCAAHYWSVIRSREVHLEYAQGWHITFKNDKGRFVEPKKYYSLMRTRLYHILKSMGYKVDVRPFFESGACIGYCFRCCGKYQTKDFQYMLTDDEGDVDNALGLAESIIEYLNNEYDDYDEYVERKYAIYARDASRKYWDSPDFITYDVSEPIIYTNEDGLATIQPLPRSICDPLPVTKPDNPGYLARRVRTSIRELALKNRVKMIPWSRRAGIVKSFLVDCDFNQKYRFIEVADRTDLLKIASSQTYNPDWRRVEAQRRFMHESSVLASGSILGDHIDRGKWRDKLFTENSQIKSMKKNRINRTIRLSWENFLSYLSVPDALNQLALNRHAKGYCLGIGCIGCKKECETQELVIREAQDEMEVAEDRREAAINDLLLLEKKFLRALDRYKLYREKLSNSVLEKVDSIIVPTIKMTAKYLEFFFFKFIDSDCACVEDAYIDRIYHRRPEVKDKCVRRKGAVYDPGFHRKKQMFDLALLPKECSDIFVGFEVSVYSPGTKPATAKRIWCNCTQTNMAQCLSPIGNCFMRYCKDPSSLNSDSFGDKVYSYLGPDGVMINRFVPSPVGTLTPRDVVCLPTYCDPNLFSSPRSPTFEQLRLFFKLPAIVFGAPVKFSKVVEECSPSVKINPAFNRDEDLF